MQITEIKKQKSKNPRYSIFLDGQFVCGLDEFSVYKYKLLVGNEIDKVELENIQFESELDGAFERAVDVISKIPKTERQLKEYLKDKGYMPKIIDSVIQKMLDYHYIDDEYYAQTFVEMRANKCGKFRLKNDLKAKGIKDSVIEKVLGELNDQ